MFLCCHGDIILHKMKRHLTFFGTFMVSLPVEYLPLFIIFTSQHMLGEKKENPTKCLTDDNVMQGM